LPVVTFGHDNYKQTEIAVIPWDQLEHFVQGEQNNLDFSTNLQGQRSTSFAIPQTH
jgi:hypothetical protein